MNPSHIIRDRVLIVLNNYSRPQNTQQIIKAWRNQSVPNNHIVVVENRPITTYPDIAEPVEPYPSLDTDGADDVWRWQINAGCPCHFYPALAYPQYQYTIFADDDLIPSQRSVEEMLRAAIMVSDQFSTIGQIGRNFLTGNPVGNKYEPRNYPVRTLDIPTKTCLTCRMHIVCTHNIIHAISFRNELARHSAEGLKLSQIHDDFLLSIGIQKATGNHSYILSPKSGNLIARDLDDDKALWRNPDHYKMRNRMVDLSIELGWSKIV